MKTLKCTAVLGTCRGESLEKFSYDLMRVLHDANKRFNREFISFNVTRSYTCYKKEWGCPEGGEPTFNLEAVANPEFVKDLELWRVDCIQYLTDLKQIYQQSTVSIQFEDVDFVYLTNKNSEDAFKDALAKKLESINGDNTDKSVGKKKSLLITESLDKNTFKVIDNLFNNLNVLFDRTTIYRSTIMCVPYFDRNVNEAPNINNVGVIWIECICFNKNCYNIIIKYNDHLISIIDNAYRSSYIVGYTGETADTLKLIKEITNRVINNDTAMYFEGERRE